MVFTLESHFDKEETDILIKAHNIIQDMMNEMEYSGLELYQGSSIDDWRDIKNKIKDLVT